MLYIHLYLLLKWYRQSDIASVVCTFYCDLLIKYYFQYCNVVMFYRGDITSS